MLKKLLSQTVIYGLSNVLVRIFPFLLTPILTHRFTPQVYALYSDFYSVAGVLSVLLTHGMETSFFRFSQNIKDKTRVYTTAMFSVFCASLFLVIVGFVFRFPLAKAFKHPNEVNYLLWFLIILATDALSAIPFALLRIENQPLKYGGIKILNSLLMAFFSVLFIVWIPIWISNDGFVGTICKQFYKPHYGIAYTFAANLIASVFCFVLLLPTILNKKLVFDFSLWQKMIRYALPITLAGLAGIINETMDRQFLKYILPPNRAEFEMGVYSAMYKMATFVALFKTAYLLGVEPFFFSHASHENSRKTYAKLMNYFTIFSALILLLLIANLPWILKWYINKSEYWSGSSVVPLILFGSTFLGIYLNLSIWYKLSDKTNYGAIISLLGACITVFLNLIGIPFFSYWACAWATLISYFVMMLTSYYWGQKIYPIPYNSKKFILYMGLSILFSCISYYAFPSDWMKIVVGNLFTLVFCYVIYILEKEQILDILYKIQNLLKKR